MSLLDNHLSLPRTLVQLKWDRSKKVFCDVLREWKDLPWFSCRSPVGEPLAPLHH